MTLNSRTMLRRQLDKRLDRIRAMLESGAVHFTPAVYHGLRVEIKKTRALFELIDACVEDFNRKESFAPLKAVFRSAGAVRDLHITESLLQKHGLQDKGGAFSRELAVRLIIAEKRFQQLLTAARFRETGRLQKAVSRAAGKITAEAVKAYFQKTEKRIGNRLCKKSIDENGLHKLRRDLKHFYYNKKAMKAGRKNTLRKMDDFQILLGQWHDCVMAGLLLSKIKLPYKVDSRQASRMKRVLAGIRKQRKTCLKKLNKVRKEVTL